MIDAARRNREDFSRRAGWFRKTLSGKESAPLEEAVSRKRRRTPPSAGTYSITSNGP